MQEIEEIAANWFAINQSDQITSQEQQDFAEWIASSPTHRLAYQEYEELWGLMGFLPEKSFGEDIGIDGDQPLSQDEKTPHLTLVENKPAHTTEEKTIRESSHCTKQLDGTNPTEGNAEGEKQKVTSVKRRLASFTFSIKAYAAAFVLFSIAVVATINQNTHIDTPAPAQYYSSNKGEIKQIQLDDGSQITLSADTKIKVDMTKDSRELELLKGQAFFDVATVLKQDQSKVPFVVSAGDMHIRVVGTQFDIHLLREKAAVTVTEGEVIVSSKTSANSDINLLPGKRVVAIGPQYSTLGLAENVDLEAISSWQKGRLTYRNANLDDVISDANRFHDGLITLGHQDLKSLRVTTSFNVDQIKEMTQLLEQILPVTVHLESNNGILILPRTQL